MEPWRKSMDTFSASNISLIKKMGAEFFGTFIMVFSAAAAPIVNQKYNGAETLIGNAMAAGIAVMAVVLSIGHISGAHLNPSVTISFAALGRFPLAQVPAYILAQVSASICASFTLKGIFHPFMSGGVTVPSVNNPQAFGLEFIVTFILMFVITSVATDTRAVGELAGIAIGGVVILDILVAGNTTGASMNPIRTIGPAIASRNYKGFWIYLVAPTLGALAGAAAYTVVKLHDNREEQRRPLRSFRRKDDGDKVISSDSITELTDSFFCLPGDCQAVCSEFEQTNVILCHKGTVAVANILRRKARVDDSGERAEV